MENDTLLVDAAPAVQAMPSEPEQVPEYAAAPEDSESLAEEVLTLRRKSFYGDLKALTEQDRDIDNYVSTLGSRRLQKRQRELERQLAEEQATRKRLEAERHAAQFVNLPPDQLAVALQDPRFRKQYADAVVMAREVINYQPPELPPPDVAEVIDDVEDILLQAEGVFGKAFVENYRSNRIGSGIFDTLPPHRFIDAVRADLGQAARVLQQRQQQARPQQAPGVQQQRQAPAQRQAPPQRAPAGNQRLAQFSPDSSPRTPAAPRGGALPKSSWETMNFDQKAAQLQAWGGVSAQEAFARGLIA